MADTSLDDFFAKKDKSKKAKKKFTTTEQIAKKLEESGKKGSSEIMAPKKEKEKTGSNAPANSVGVVQTAEQVRRKEDEEWRDFEEEKEKDYSGLKIQNLQIGDPKDDDSDRDRNFGEDEDGEPIRQRDCNTGPWNKMHGQSDAAAAIVVRSVTPPPEIEKKDDPPTQGQKYRPPHTRLSSTSMGSGGSRGRSSKTAPEISSDFDFPSLSAAVDPGKASKKGGTNDWERGFESVKRGSRTSEENVSRGPKLDLGNKFDALSHGDTS